jgi:conjugal transfer pilus assembly protein TraF
MRKYCLLSLFFCILNVGYADTPAGFLWYNVPAPERVVKPGVLFHHLSYTDRDAVLRFYTMEALHKVRFTHQVEDERVFLALQDYWLREATHHARLNQETLLKYPEYDFSVTHPTSHLGTQITSRVLADTHHKKLKNLAKQSGFIFFYRGENPYDQQQIPIIQDVCRQFDFTLMPVSVDGRHAKELPGSRLDAGHARALGVHHFPALMLVNPKTEHVKPIAYGFTTQDVIKQRLLM